MLDGMKNIAAFELSGLPLAVPSEESTDALLADLQQQLAAVVRVFLHHAGRGARDPDVVVLVEVAGVQPRIEQLRVAPGIDDVAVRIELDDRRRESSRVQLAVEHVLPVEDEHVVLRVDADVRPGRRAPSGWAAASAR